MAAIENRKRSGTSIKTGSGSPLGTVTPGSIGQEYHDTDTGGLRYKANGLTSADRVEIVTATPA